MNKKITLDGQEIIENLAALRDTMGCSLIFNQAIEFIESVYRVDA